MAKKAELYALDTTTPWEDFANPEPVREGTDGLLDAGAQRDQQAIYDGRVSIYTSQSNVRRAIITALNKSVPKKHKRVDGGIGAMTHKVNQCRKPSSITYIIYTAGQRRTKKRTTKLCGKPHTIQVTPWKIFLTALKNVL